MYFNCMVSGRTILLILLIRAGLDSQAQNIGRIYLGDDMATKFDEGYIIRNKGDYSFFEFLGCQTLWHEMISDDIIENTQRDGIILEAKSTITTIINARAAFAKNNDSCIIDYHHLPMEIF